jgi:methylmalonyl-CoA mutase N-terminal domain/subunit
VVRVAYQALAAVLGGTQSLHTNSRDEALALPSEESVTIALRTQQLLAYESGVADTVDPLAGSFLVESLTDEIEKRAAALIGRVEEMGGATRAIEAGFMQTEIADSAYRYQQEVEQGKRVVVGVNRFQQEKDDKERPSLGLLKVDPELEKKRVAGLARFKAGRDAAAVKRTLGALAEAAKGDVNLMPFVVESVRAGCTVGEMSDALRAVFGTFRPTGAL